MTCLRVERVKTQYADGYFRYLVFEQNMYSERNCGRRQAFQGGNLVQRSFIDKMEQAERQWNSVPRNPRLGILRKSIAKLKIIDLASITIQQQDIGIGVTDRKRKWWP